MYFSEMWRLIFLLLLAYNFNCCKACADFPQLDPDVVPDSEEFFADGLLKPHDELLLDELDSGLRRKRDTILTVDTQIANSRSGVSEDAWMDDEPFSFRRSGDTIATLMSQIVNTRSVEEMIKRINVISKKFPAELLKEKSLKPYVAKFNRALQKLGVKAKPVLELARKLEKSGKQKSKKQLAEFKLKMTELQKHIQTFTKSVNAESKKQRNKNEKIMKSNPNDLNVLEDAKRCISMGNIISDTLQFLQSIPGKIICLISGNCEENGGGGGDSDSSDDDGEGDVGEEEEEEEEEDPEESPDD